MRVSDGEPTPPASNRLAGLDAPNIVGPHAFMRCAVSALLPRPARPVGLSLVL
jgi:hypothetical protein